MNFQPMSLQHILLVLRWRWRWRWRWRLVVGVLVAVMLGSLLASLLLPRKYTAEASVVVDTRPADPVLGAVLPVTSATSVMSTQVDILQSDRVAQRAVVLLKLDQGAERRQQWFAETGGQGSLIAWLAASLKTRLKIMPVRESNVVSIVYTDASPEMAAAVTNAFAQAYLDTHLELKVASATQYNQWFAERTQSFRTHLENAAQRLSAYQQAHRIVNTDEKLDEETARLMSLSGELVQVQGQRALTRSRHSQAGAAELLPEVIGNNIIQNLKVRLTELQRHQAALRLREAHPEYRKVAGQIEALNTQIDEETRRIAGSLGTADRINAAREAEISGALATQKRKILALRAERDRVAVLQRDLESAQRDYDMVTQRLAQTSLESQVPHTNVAQLSTATQPAEPSSPRVVLNTVLSFLFGSLLGIGLALLLEQRTRWLRSATDLPELLNVPILAVLPPPSGVQRQLPRPRPKEIAQWT